MAGLPAQLQEAIAKLKQGPVQVEFSDDDGVTWVPVYPQDSVDITFARGIEPAEVDIVGQVDSFTTGDGATFELGLPERSLEVLNVIYPDLTSGTDADGNTYRAFGRSAGLTLSDNACQVRMRPFQTRSSGTNEVKFWKVVPDGDASLAQGKSSPHLFTQSFRALPDYTREDGDMVCRINAAAR